MTAKIIDGKKIAQNIRNEITNEVKKLQLKYKKIPNIVSIKIGSDPSSDLYLKLRDKACAEVGIESEHLEFPEDVTEKKVIDAIEKLNSDQNVHGILIQFPIPSHLSSDRLINALDPKKDVEGFHPKNMGATLLGNENIIPCTPLAVLTILYHENVKLQGKDIVIINHSNVVGKPLAALFLNRNATVSVCHIFTKDFKNYSKKADILISAAGVPKLIKKEHVKKDSFVIDVGIIKTKEGVCGDVDLESIKELVGKITPVPGGVGPVTVACSLKNMIKTYKNCFEEINE
jgi:methylenetetrahydrofolate dehydrogenase (NADP+) / methenyltetrahydrofolate cyclohydrolase